MMLGANKHFIPCFSEGRCQDSILPCRGIRDGGLSIAVSTVLVVRMTGEVLEVGMIAGLLGG